jgi:Fur family ferric uptake transcriptional regulator
MLVHTTARSRAALLNTMRAHGLRVSTARRRVLDGLLAAEHPLTAAELGGDQAATYRNLQALESIGIVRHVHFGHGPGRYVLAGRSGGWATCEACGRSRPLTPGTLEQIRCAVRDACGFDAPFNHFPIVGRCPDCELR